MSWMLALAVAGSVLGLGGEPTPDPPLLDVQAGPTAVTVDEAGLQVTAPVLGSTAVQPCLDCLAPGLGEGLPLRAGSPEPAPSASRVPWPAAAPPPEAVAGAGLGAALLAALAWVAQRLLGLPLVGFSRIEDDALARHPKRQLALQYIQANPGANLNQLHAALGLAWGTTVYHLSRLERGGLVAVRRIAGQRTHWPLGAAPPAGSLSPPAKALAGLVQAQPGLAQAQLARHLGWGRATACRHLADLQSAGLVLADRDGRRLRYRATERLATLVA